jgi:hypothetical protein
MPIDWSSKMTVNRGKVVGKQAWRKTKKSKPTRENKTKMGQMTGMRVAFREYPNEKVQDRFHQKDVRGL